MYVDRSGDQVTAPSINTTPSKIRDSHDPCYVIKQKIWDMWTYTHSYLVLGKCYTRYLLPLWAFAIFGKWEWIVILDLKMQILLRIFLRSADLHRPHFICWSVRTKLTLKADTFRGEQLESELACVSQCFYFCCVNERQLYGVFLVRSHVHSCPWRRFPVHVLSVVWRLIREPSSASKPATSPSRFSSPWNIIQFILQVSHA